MRKENTADMSGMVFDPAIPMDQRPEHLLRMVKDLTCFQAAGLHVKLEFKQTAPCLQECFTALVRRKKTGR